MWQHTFAVHGDGFFFFKKEKGWTRFGCLFAVVVVVVEEVVVVVYITVEIRFLMMRSIFAHELFFFLCLGLGSWCGCCSGGSGGGSSAGGSLKVARHQV